MKDILKGGAGLISVVIVDDDMLVCNSLKIILSSSGNFEIMAVGNSGVEAIDLYNRYKPDVLLSDIRMEPLNGIEAAERILESHNTARILFLTTFSDDEYIVKALKIGAKGYILKESFESIVPSVIAVMNGQTVYGDEIAEKFPALLLKPHKERTDDFGLSDKELEIIAAVADGLSNKEIAGKLFLGEGTVRNYISIILEKLDLRDRTQMAIFWYKNFV